ncbi:MAG TPA: SPFH domain-containing protein [Ktedonobacterales bacterium]
MAFIFAAIGVIQAVVLLYAPNDAFWTVGVVGGFLVFVSAIFFIFFLPIFALILSILLLSLGGVALRERYYPVKEGTVAVMGLFGRYNRTLQPGFNLRIPGEKLLGVVETQSSRYETRVPPITLVSGEQIMLGVAMTYQVVPGEEHLAIRLTKDWQKPIQQQLQAVVQDEISILSIQDFRHTGGAYTPPGGYAAADVEDDQGASPLERINERLTNAMSMKVADRGVAIHEVKARLLGPPQLPGGAPAAQQQALPASFRPAPSAHPTVALPFTPQGAGQAAGDALQGTSDAGSLPFLAAPAGMVGYQVPSMYPPGQPVAPPALEVGGPQINAQPEPMSLLSAQALAEAYDAVVRHRITDLATIQRIISQFEAVAADPDLSQEVPFDAAAGARYLTNHLYHLQMRSLSALSQQGDTSYPADDAPAPPDEEEEDEG